MRIVGPTYLVDPVRCRRNINRMAEKCVRSGVIFRPHFKTHQSQLIGEWFREPGVTRITVSSVTMASYFFSAGWKDITVAFPVNLPEIDLINRMGSEIRLNLVVEDEGVVRELSAKLTFQAGVFIKIDSGAGRTGLSPDELPVIRRIAGDIYRNRNMKLEGLLTHAGHTYRASGTEQIRHIFAESCDLLKRLRSALPGGSADVIISVGDTPSCSLVEDLGAADEVRPGNFVFYDLMQLNLGICQTEDIAAVMACPVVAIHARRCQAVIYGGAIHFSKDFLVINGKTVYAQMIEMDNKGWYNRVPGAYLTSVSQEHGILDAPEPVLQKLAVGQIIGLVPVHACLAGNLMRGYQLLNGEPVDHLAGK